MRAITRLGVQLWDQVNKWKQSIRDMGENSGVSEEPKVENSVVRDHLGTQNLQDLHRGKAWKPGLPKGKVRKVKVKSE